MMLLSRKCKEKRIKIWERITSKYSRIEEDDDDDDENCIEMGGAVAEGVDWETRETFTKSLEAVGKWLEESPDITAVGEFPDLDELYGGPARNTRARKRLFDKTASREPIPIQREKSQNRSNQSDEKCKTDNALFVAENERSADNVAENISNDPVQSAVENAETEVLCKSTFEVPASESLQSENAKANSILDILEGMIPMSEVSSSNASKADDNDARELTHENESGSRVLSTVIDFIKPLPKLNRSTEVNVDCISSEEKIGRKGSEIVEDCSNSPRVEHFREGLSKTMPDKGENLLTEMQDSMEKEPSALHTEPQAVRSHKSPANSHGSKCCDSGFHDNSREEASCAVSSEKLKVQHGDKKDDIQICSSYIQQLVEKTPEREGVTEQLITTVEKSLPNNNLQEEASERTKRCLSNEFPGTKEQLSNVALSPQIQAQEATSSNLLPSTNTPEHPLHHSLQSHRKNQTLQGAHDDKLVEIKALEKSHANMKLCLHKDLSRSEENNISKSLSDSNDSSSGMSGVNILADDSDMLTKSSTARVKSRTYSRKQESDPMSLLVQSINTLPRMASVADKDVEQFCKRNRSMLENKNDEIIKECVELSSSDKNEISEDYSRRLLRVSSVLNQENNSSSTRNKIKRDKFQPCSVDSRSRPKNLSCCFKERECDPEISQIENKQNTFNRKTISSDLRSEPKQVSKTSRIVRDSKSNLSEMENISPCKSEDKTLCFPKLNVHTLGLEISSFPEDAKKMNCTLNMTVPQNEIAEKGNVDVRFFHPLSHNNTFPGTAVCTKNQIIPKGNDCSDNFPSKLSNKGKADLGKKNHATCRNLQPEDESSTEVSDLIEIQNLKEFIRIARRKPSQYVSESELQTAENCLEESFPAGNTLQNISRTSTARSSREKDVKSSHQPRRDHEFEQDRGLHSKVKQVSLAEKCKNVDISSEGGPRVRAELSKSVQEIERAQVERRYFSSIRENLVKSSTSNKRDVTQPDSGHVRPVENDMLCKMQPAKGLELRCERELGSAVSITESSKTVDKSFRIDPTERLEFPANILEKACAQDQRSFAAHVIEKPSVVKASDCYKKLYKGSHSHRRKRRKPKIPIRGIDIFAMCDDVDTNQFVGNDSAQKSQTSPCTSGKKRDMFIPSRHVVELELQTAENCLEESFPASNSLQSISRISTARSLRERDVKSSHQPGRDHEFEQDRGLHSKVKQGSLAEKCKNVDISSEGGPRVRAELSKSVQENLVKSSTSNKRDVTQPDLGHVRPVENDMLCKIQPAKGLELRCERELGSAVSITESSKTVDKSFRIDPTERLEFPTNILEKACAQDQRSFAAHVIEKPSVVKASDCYKNLYKGSHSHRRKRRKPKIPIRGIDIFAMCDDVDTNQFVGNDSAQKSQTSLDSSGKKRGIFVTEQELDTGYGYCSGENTQLKKCYGMPIECIESKKKKVHHADEPQMRPSDENNRSFGDFFKNDTRNSSFVNCNSYSCNEGEVNHKKVSMFGSADLSRKDRTACRKLPAGNSIKDLIEVQNLKQFENVSSNKVPGKKLSKCVPELEIITIDNPAQNAAVSTVESIRERNAAVNHHKTEGNSDLLKKGVKCNKQLTAGHELNQVNSFGSRIETSVADDISLKIHKVKAKSSVNVLEEESDKEQEKFTSHITEKLNLGRHSSSYQKQKKNLPSHAKSRINHRIPFLDSDTSSVEEPRADQSVPNDSRIRTSTVLLGKGEEKAFVVERTIEQNCTSEHSSEKNTNWKTHIDGKSLEYKRKETYDTDRPSALYNKPLSSSDNNIRVKFVENLKNFSSDKLNSHLYNGVKEHCSEVLIKCGDNDRTVNCSENVLETERDNVSDSSNAAREGTRHCDLSLTVVHEDLMKRPKKVRHKPYRRIVFLK